MNDPDPTTENTDTPWRVGRKVGRTLYNSHEQLIGVMDTPELAETVVEAVNDIFSSETNSKEES